MNLKNKLDVVIIGASGYTGFELLRLLARHPHVHLTGITSENNAGASLTDVAPALRGFYPDAISFEAIGAAKERSWVALDLLLERAQFFFTALPHGTSTPCVDYLIKKGARVADLSADYRLRDLKVYEAWYGKHHAPALLAEAVYGLPELYREALKKTRLVAVPGCYPTSAILALTPLIKENLIQLDSVIIDSKSGASGAGRAPKVEQLFTEVYGGLRAYGIPRHRHTPEIEQELTVLAQRPVRVTFTPHLIPIARGILTCAYASLINAKTPVTHLQEAYAKTFGDEHFIRLLGSEGTLPDTRYVAGTYLCDLAVRLDERTGRVIALSAMDNLCRGASGMAVAAMNLMNGWDEDLGLQQVPLYP